MDIICPKCQTHYRNLPDKYRNRNLRCKKCNSRFNAGEISTPQETQLAPLDVLNNESSAPQETQLAASDGLNSESLAPQETQLAPAEGLNSESFTPRATQIDSAGNSFAQQEKTSTDQIAQSPAKTSKISQLIELGSEKFLCEHDANAQSINDLRIGDVLLELYEVKAILGEGQFGKVFQVRHRGWNLDLALKTPKAKALAAGSENIEKEAETWVNLDLHPNIVNCYYVRRIAGIPQIFSEYVDGGDLKALITSKQLYQGGEKKALIRILDIAIQFAWGLHYAHEQGLIHQDIKPANVMMTSKGVIKVTDFGLAKAGAMANISGQENDQTMVIAGMGMTPAYASPEQLLGRRLTRRTDLWSWGVCLLEMILGFCQWESGTVAPGILEAYLNNTLDDDPALSTIPIAMTALIENCFQEEEENRPKNLYEVAESLKAIYKSVTNNGYPRQQPQERRGTASSLNNQAISLLDLGQIDEAVQLWESALKIDPQHFETKYNTLLYRWKSQGLEESELLSKVESYDKGAQSGRINHSLAKLYIHFGLYDKAIKILNDGKEKFTQLAPGVSNEVCKELGLALCAKYRLAIDSSRWGNIAECLKKAVGGKITDPYAITAYTVALQRNGEKQEAAKFFKVATRVGVIPKQLKQAIALFLPGYEVLYRLARKNIKTIQFINEGENILFSQGNNLFVWSLREKQLVFQMQGHIGKITQMTVSPDGQYILSGSEQGDIRVWDSATGDALKVWSAHKGSVNALQMTPCGQFVVTASSEKKLCLWDVHKASKITSFFGEGHDSGISDMHISISGKEIISAGSDKVLRTWDTLSGHPQKILSGHNMAVTCVRWIDDSHALSGSLDKTIRLWDTISGECIKIFTGHNGQINVLRVSADKEYALSGSSDGSVRYWNLKTGTSYVIRKFSGPVVNIALDDSGQFALVVTQGGISLLETHNPFRYQAAYLFSLPESAAEVDQLYRDYQRHLSSASSAIANKDYLLAREDIIQARSIKGYERDQLAFQRWSDLYCVLPKLKLKDVWKLAELREHKEWITSLAISPASDKLYSASKDQSIYQWDVETQKIDHIFPKFEKPISVIRVTDDGTGMLVAFGENIQILDVQTGQKLTLFIHHTGKVTAATITADGRFVLSADDKGAFYLWRLLTGELMAQFSNKDNIINTIAVTPDGRFAITGNRNSYQVMIWDMATGKVDSVLEEHENVVTSLVVTSEGRYILSGSADGTLRLWQVQSSRKKSLRVMRGHTKRINQIAIDSQGKLAISASEDKTVRLWDVISGECLHTFEDISARYTSAILSMDGHYAFAGNTDGSITVWCLDWLLEKNISHKWDNGADIYLHNYLSTRTVTEPHKELSHVERILKFSGYGWLPKEEIAAKLVEFSQSSQNKNLPGSKLSRSRALEKHQTGRKKTLFYAIIASMAIVMLLVLVLKDKPDEKELRLTENPESISRIEITNETEKLTVDKILNIAELLARMNNKVAILNGRLETASLKVPYDIKELSRSLNLHKTDLIDAWGQPFKYQGIRLGAFRGRIILRSAGRDQIYKTDDDLILNGYPHWDFLIVRKNNQRIIKLSSARNHLVQKQQEKEFNEIEEQNNEQEQEEEFKQSAQEEEMISSDTPEVDEQEVFTEESTTEYENEQKLDGMEVKVRQEIFVEEQE